MYLFGCRTQRFMIWSLHLNLAMADSYRVFWNGSFGVLPPISDLKVLSIVSHVAIIRMCCLSYWFGWYFFGSKNKESCVPECVSPLSYRSSQPHNLLPVIIDMCLKSSWLPFQSGLCHWDAVSVDDIVLFCGLCDQWIFCLFRLDLLIYYDITQCMIFLLPYC